MMFARSRTAFQWLLLACVSVALAAGGALAGEGPGTTPPAAETVDFLS